MTTQTGGSPTFPWETRRLSRRVFLATPVKALARLHPDGSVTVAEKPAGLSERLYRDHLASGPRVTLRAREARTEGLPERLWGGVRMRGLDPVSARVVARTYTTKGWIVSCEWTDPEPPTESLFPHQ